MIENLTTKHYIILVSIAALIGLIFAMSQINSSAQGSINEDKTLEVSFRSVGPHEFKKLIESKNSKLIDVRTKEEYLQGHISGASQVDYYNSSEFNKFLNSQNKDEAYIIYCRSGNRTAQTIEKMRELGFKNVTELKGGYNAWKSAGF